MTRVTHLDGYIEVEGIGVIFVTPYGPVHAGWIKYKRAAEIRAREHKPDVEE